MAAQQEAYKFGCINLARKTLDVIASSLAFAIYKSDYRLQ